MNLNQRKGIAVLACAAILELSILGLGGHSAPVVVSPPAPAPVVRQLPPKGPSIDEGWNVFDCTFDGRLIDHFPQAKLIKAENQGLMVYWYIATPDRADPSNPRIIKADPTHKTCKIVRR